MLETIKRIFLKEKIEQTIVKTNFVSIFIEYKANIHTNQYVGNVLYCDYDKNFDKDVDIINFKNKLEIIFSTLLNQFKCSKLNGKVANIDMLLDDTFLFISIKGLIDFREYKFISNKKDIFKFKDDWLMAGTQRVVNDIVFRNDYDGEGLYFYVDKRSDSYNLLMNLLKGRFYFEENYINISESYLKELGEKNKL